MNDLPIFLQMFVRLFAFFSLGAWLQTLAPRETEKPAEAADPTHVCVVKPAVPKAVLPPSAQALAPAPLDRK